MYKIRSQNKFKTSMLRSCLCNYSDVCIFINRTLTVPNLGTAANPDNRNRKIIFKIFVPFTDCISGINNKEIDHTKDIDVVMPMYNLIEYSEN